MLRAAIAAPSLRASSGRGLHVQRADDAALFVVEHRPVDGAGQVVFGKLGRRAGVDDGVEAAERRLRLRPGSGIARACQRTGARASSSSLSMLQLGAGLLQRRAVDQEGVFHPLAQRADLGQLQVDAGCAPAPGRCRTAGRSGRWR
jgi:hypothetical protein